VIEGGGTHRIARNKCSPALLKVIKNLIWRELNGDCYTVVGEFSLRESSVGVHYINHFNSCFYLCEVVIRSSSLSAVSVYKMHASSTTLSLFR
jgi:hypothetical protein